MLRRWVKLAPIVGAMSLLVGCVEVQPYRTKIDPRPLADGSIPPSGQQPDDSDTSQECRSGTCVHFVEYDEFGNLFSRRQAQRAVDAAKAIANEAGTVLVYVHGWHHNARYGDGDVEAVHRLVQRASSMDARSRPRHPGRGKVLGIYLGWRGESIRSDGFIPKALSMLLTFWGRKSAAHAVGNGGGLYEVLRKLSAVRQAHPDARLLIIGHSFGGAVVYSAIAQTLVEQIMTDATSPSKSIAPAPSKSIAPLADLVVIVNPAFEAMKLRPQFELARSQEYGNDLAPRLLIVTTQSDWATRHAFPLGRWLSTVGDQHADEDSHAQNVTAVGHYLPFVTHQLAEAASPCAAGGAEADRESLVHVGGTYSYCFAPLPNTKAKAVVLARCDEEGTCKEVAGNHHLTRGRVEDGRIPYRFPILNIRTTDVVMTGHNDIWNDTMESFISQILVLAIRVPGDIPMK